MANPQTRIIQRKTRNPLWTAGFLFWCERWDLNPSRIVILCGFQAFSCEVRVKVPYFIGILMRSPTWIRSGLVICGFNARMSFSVV